MQDHPSRNVIYQIQEMSDFMPMALPQDLLPMAAPTASGYFIYRDLVQGEAFDPTAPLNFFPPKDSDELFDALRAKYPHVSSHAERMRDAVIEFLVEERNAEAQRSPPNIAMDAANANWASMSASTSSFENSPEFLNLATPASSDYPSSSQTPSYAQSSTYAASDKQSPPSLDQMTGVFSVSASAQPKQRVRRKMTEAEKIEYRNRRIVKACDKCARRKRKCHHNQPAAQQPTASAGRRVGKSAALFSTSMKSSLSSQSGSTLSSTNTPFSGLGELDFDQASAQVDLDEMMLDLEDPFASFTHNGDFFSSKNKHVQSDWTQDFAYANTLQDWSQTMLPDFELYSQSPNATAGDTWYHSAGAGATLNFPPLESISQESRAWNPDIPASSQSQSSSTSLSDAGSSGDLVASRGSRPPPTLQSRHQLPFGIAEISTAGQSAEMPLSHRFSWGPQIQLGNQNNDNNDSSDSSGSDHSGSHSSSAASSPLNATHLGRSASSSIGTSEAQASQQCRASRSSRLELLPTASESSSPESRTHRLQTVKTESDDGPSGSTKNADRTSAHRKVARSLIRRQTSSNNTVSGSGTMVDALTILQNLSGLQTNSITRPTSINAGNEPGGAIAANATAAQPANANATHPRRARAALRARNVPSAAAPAALSLVHTPSSDFVNANRLSANFSASLTTALAVNLVHVAHSDLYVDRLSDHVRYRDHHGRAIGQASPDMHGSASSQDLHGSAALQGLHGSAAFATFAKPASQPAFVLAAQLLGYVLAALFALLALQLVCSASSLLSSSSWAPALVGDVRPSIVLLAVLAPSGVSARIGMEAKAWKISRSISRPWGFVSRCLRAVVPASVMA